MKQTTKQEKTKDNSTEIETETQNKFERLENQVLELNGIKVITDKDETFITQVRFSTTDDKIKEVTYKPIERIEEQSKYKGLDVIKRFNKSLTMQEIPSKLLFLNRLINENEIVRISCDLNALKAKDKDNKTVTYYFLNESDFIGLYPMDENNREIKEVK